MLQEEWGKNGEGGGGSQNIRKFEWTLFLNGPVGKKNVYLEKNLEVVGSYPELFFEMCCLSNWTFTSAEIFESPFCGKHWFIKCLINRMIQVLLGFSS